MNGPPNEKAAPVLVTPKAAQEREQQFSVATAEKISNPDKRLATLKAALALRGFEVRECQTGGYFISRWNLAKFCPAWADLEIFARQVGAEW